MTDVHREVPAQRRSTPDGPAAVARELRRLAERHEVLARELFARAGYWRADPEAVEHAVAARVLLADAEAFERPDVAAVGR